MLTQMYCTFNRAAVSKDADLGSRAPRGFPVKLTGEKGP